MKMRSRKGAGFLAIILAAALTFEGLFPLPAYAYLISDEPVGESYDALNELDEESCGAPGELAEVSYDEAGDSALSESVDEGKAAADETEDVLTLVGDDETVSLDSSDNTIDTSDDTADMTVMLYSVGSDLEGKSMSATVDILEIMEGLYISDIEEPEVNFIVETGGVDTGLKDRPRSEVIEERRVQIKEEYDKVAAGKGDRYLERYNDITGKIAWNKNERFEIHTESLVPAKSQPSNPDRFMTKADGNDVLQELAEFIKTTKADYPAKQYMLILWDHGGGPLGGLGYDERDKDMSTFQAWQIAPTMEAAGVSANDKFAFIDYDACLMGSLENMLAWSPYTRYYCGSEDLESNNGDFYENWVSELCLTADGNMVDFSKDSVVDKQMEAIGKKIVNDYYEWYEKSEDIGTKSLVKTSEAAALGNSLSDYAEVCLDLFELDPLETYYGVYYLRSLSQDFHGREKGITDLADFVRNMDSLFDKCIMEDVAANSEIKSTVSRMKKAGTGLEKQLKKAVLLHKETSKYELTNPGGLTVFLPYIATYEVKNYFDGYADVEPSDILNDYKNFVGVFSAIHTAGELIVEDGKGETDVDKALQEVLNNYGLQDIYKGKMAEIPTEIADHRLQNEGMKIFEDDGKIYYKRRDYKLVYSVDQSPSVKKADGTEHYLGYLPAGGYEVVDDAWRQRLTNYNEKKWFAFRDNNGKYIPVAICDIDSGFVNTESQERGDQFAAATDAMVPVLYDGMLCLLDVGFEQGSDTGTVYGMWPFEFDSRNYGRYISVDSLKEGGEEISILADVPNVLEGDKDAIFDSGEPESSVLGKITLNKSTVLYRGVQLCDDSAELADGLTSMDMLYFMRDLFGSLYLFDNLTEEVNVSLAANSAKKPKNSTLNKDDLKLEFTGEKGVYEDSEFEDVTYYYKDEDGNQKELIEKDGKFYTEEEGPDGLEGISGQDIPESVSGKNLKEFKIERDTEIMVLPKDITINNVAKIDEANIDLSKYFTLNAGTLSVTIKAGDATVKPVEDSDQFTDMSKKDAKRAMVCDIAPVTFTGRKLITTQSGSKGSKMIELALYSEDGTRMLREGVDYTVSYKNNKNAADSTAGKKAPSILISGKGDYAGMKYSAAFTINKEDLSEADISFKKYIGPLAKKGLSMSPTVVLNSGIRVPAKQYSLLYFDSDDNPITFEQLTAMYASADDGFMIGVSAQAVQSSKDLVPGSKTEIVHVALTPKSKGSLKVTLTDNKISVKENKSASDFIKERLKKAAIGNKEYNYEDLVISGVFRDSKLSQVTGLEILDTAGTCYIGVTLTPEKRKESGCFSIAAVKVGVTDGIKLKKGDVTLEKTEYRIDDLEKLTESVPVTLKFAPELNWDRFEVTYSTRDGGSVTDMINIAQTTDNKLTLDSIDNGTPGDYTVEIKGSGMNTGSIKLKYKIK
ncbi:MAG: hypothetical protein K6E63_07275 [Lachnospiraceae bacterium]|nr:hypothetical protein [Lachnospiraceae bacterium]